MEETVLDMTDIKFCGITLLCSLGLMFNQEKFEEKRMILKSHFQSYTEFQNNPQNFTTGRDFKDHFMQLYLTCVERKCLPKIRVIGRISSRIRLFDSS